MAPSVCGVCVPFVRKHERRPAADDCQHQAQATAAWDMTAPGSDIAGNRNCPRRY